MKMFKHEFQVRATSGFTFPLDMLRYDCCYFAEERDARRVESTMGYKEVEEFNGMVIYLERVAEKSWKPTEDRWKSFGWDVRQHNVTPR